MVLRLFNTATRNIEDFAPLNPPIVTMYNCGPTVYNYAHIGNLRAYVFADVLRRVLEQNGYTVNQVINITDVGHLVSDDDEGDDKIELGAKREGKSVEHIIKQYSDAFFADLKSLNIKSATKYPRATNYIDEQKKLIETLSEKGYTYTTTDGIYFDTQKFPHYADFAKLDIHGMKAGARVSLGEKRNPTDFALWKFSPEDGVRREQEWLSPLGLHKMGFPGWHIECSAIAMKELGETIDIHTGGIDHIPVHHTNEIAQSESATGKAFARYWMHSAFMNVDGQKMSKSLGNTYRLTDLAEHGISPEAFRYWLLTASYRTQVNFTWEAVEGAQHALNKMRKAIYELPDGGKPSTIHDGTTFMVNFELAISEDLMTYAVISQIWDLLKNTNPSRDISPADCKATILEFDKVLGLNLLKREEVHSIIISPELQSLLNERESLRDAKNWLESDRLRDEIRTHGYEVKDTSEGQQLEQI